jgi:HK97 family phage major capsid protein
MNAKKVRLTAVAIAAASMAAIAHQAGAAVIFNGPEDATIESLKARLGELNETSRAIQAKADAEKRDLNADEEKELDACLGEFEEVEASIARRTRIVAQASRLGTPEPRITQPDPVAAPEPRAPSNAAPSAPRDGLRNTRLSTLEERQRWGFTNMGDFAIAVRGAVVNPSNIDGRLTNAAASTYGQEGVGADGGFAVPPEWRAEIMKQVDAEDGFLSMTDVQTISSNSITYPVDESPAWASSGGIRAYWDGEASTINQSKPVLKDLTVKTHRLTALVPITEELQSDAAAMSSYITGKAGEVIAFKLNDAILNGTGSGQPLGIMNAACTVSVAKETSQTAGTVHGRNVLKMMARMPASSFKRSAWLVNQDVLPQLGGLAMDVTKADGTAAGAGILYMQPQGLANQSAFGSILGRPIIVTEACQTVGTVGDIVLADMSKYLSVVKGGLKTDYSIHLWFDQAINAYRFILRMNGQPWLSAPITRKNGSNTLSNFVTLATRA